MSSPVQRVANQSCKLAFSHPGLGNILRLEDLGRRIERAKAEQQIKLDRRAAAIAANTTTLGKMLGESAADFITRIVRAYLRSAAALDTDKPQAGK